MKNLSQWIADNINHNAKQDFHHIKDPYFKEKLNQGLIKYDPVEFANLSNISVEDEKELKRKGVN